VQWLILYISSSVVKAFPLAREASDCINASDLELLDLAADLAQSSCGETQPHPNAACILTDPSGHIVGQASLWAQGTEAPEAIAARLAGGRASGGTAYLNLETGDCHGDASGIRALLNSGVRRAVVGMKHPLSALRNQAVEALRSGGVDVCVLAESLSCLDGGGKNVDTFSTLRRVLAANEALLHRVATHRPLGMLKYAMTLDGKIAASSGHSSWVSSSDSRQIVFDTRARSDAVIVGGQTVRRDNPRLTTRKESGHQPVRIVMSRTLDLPRDAALWDVSHAPTIVATQRGAKQEFQKSLRQRGVEVIEFDFLTPDGVAEYCYQRGFLSCLWECGGMLAAPAVSGGAIHKVMAFVAPKIIGGTKAPTPVGDLGFVEMTQALDVQAAEWKQVGPDLMFSGYLPRSGGPVAVAAALGLVHHDVAGELAVSKGGVDAKRVAGKPYGVPQRRKHPHQSHNGNNKTNCVVEFYKSWDRFGSLSNFTPHAIAMLAGPMTSEILETFHPAEVSSSSSEINPALQVWPSVEHYYQAQKFAGVNRPETEALIAEIAKAPCPERAAAIGRAAQRCTPELMRPDWEAVKVASMHAALRAKFAAHSGPREMLMSTSPSVHIVEAAPHDYFWGRGLDGSGLNMLGKLLVQVRSEISEGRSSIKSTHLPEQHAVER